MTAVKSPSSLKVQNGDVASFPNRDGKGHNAPLCFRWLSPDAEIIHRVAEMEVPETRGSDRVAPLRAISGVQIEFGREAKFRFLTQHSDEHQRRQHEPIEPRQ